MSQACILVTFLCTCEYIKRLLKPPASYISSSWNHSRILLIGLSSLYLEQDFCRFFFRTRAGFLARLY